MPKTSDFQSVFQLMVLARMLDRKRGTTFKEFNAEQDKPISRKTWNNMLNKIDYLTQNTSSTLTESEGDEHHLEKRWTLKGNPFLIIDEVNQEEITELKIACKTGGFENKKIIKQLAQKLESQATKTKTRMQDDIADYLKSRGIMNQVSVQANENPEIKHKLEESIESFRLCKIKYKANNDKRFGWRLIKPLGLISSNRFMYLVAQIKEGTFSKPLLFFMRRIKEVEITEQVFVESEFNLDEFTAESFGVFRGDDSIETTWRFSKKVSEKAINVSFHPKQKIKKNKDGSVDISFRARGHQEMIWELLNPEWFGEVKIIKPQTLKKEFVAYLERAKKIGS